MGNVFLPKNIKSLSKTTESSDEDYLIIESIIKGTRLIKKKDLLASAKLQVNGGIYYSDNNTVSLDLESIATEGLSGNNTTGKLGVFHDTSLTAIDGRLSVVDANVLKTGPASSINYYNTSGNRTNLPHTIFPAVDYWDKNGNLQTVSLSSYEILTFDSNLNPIKVNANATEKYILFGNRIGTMRTLATNVLLPNSTYMVAPTKIVTDDTYGFSIYNRHLIVSDLIRDDLGSVSVPTSLPLSGIDRINLPVGRYILDEGYMNVGMMNCYPVLQHYGLSANGAHTVELIASPSDATQGTNITSYVYKSSYSTIYGNAEFQVTQKTNNLGATIKDYLKVYVYTENDNSGTSLSGTVTQSPQMNFWKPNTYAISNRDDDISMFCLRFRYIGPTVE